jgi:hypothetical protein
MDFVIAAVTINEGREAPSGSSDASLGVEFAASDRGRHIRGLLAVGGTVLELDDGKQSLAGETLDVLAAAARPVGLSDEFVIDALVIQCLLDPVALKPVRAEECEATTVELDAHCSSCLSRSVVISHRPDS